jgi:uncharacterized protein
VALFLLSGDMPSTAIRNRWSLILKDIAVRFGNGKLMFFVVFLASLLGFVDAHSIEFIILLIYSLLIWSCQPQTGLWKALKIIRSKDTLQPLGMISKVRANGTFLIRSSNNVSLQDFETVEFSVNQDSKRRTFLGMVYQKFYTDTESGYHILRIRALPTNEDHVINQIYRSGQALNIEKVFVGLVAENSTIRKLRFLYNSQEEMELARLLQVDIEDKSVLYQIVEAITKVAEIEKKNETGFIIGEAIQIGVWNTTEFRFELFGWVPNINTPVYVAKLSASAPCNLSGTNDCQIGTIPYTDYPIILDRVLATTHHLGIFGTTGSGKSVFARHLIRKIIEIGTKVICIDFTGECLTKFADLGITTLISSGDEQDIISHLKVYNKEMAEFRNQRKDYILEKELKAIEDKFFECIHKFLSSEQKIVVFTLPGIANDESTVGYTKYFFSTLFKLVQGRGEDSQRLCVVLEEAHTIIPEWNFSGIDEKVSQPLVNTIGQIALQGRKYNIGFIVIAQRTANVSKTVITQCNTIVAFQQFDKTSKEFLSIYFGSDVSDVLSELKPRQAVVCGKALRSSLPIIIKVPDIEEGK